MKTFPMFLILAVIFLPVAAGCSDDSDELEPNICSFVNPDLVDRPSSGADIPGCGTMSVSISNVQRIQPFAVVSSFNFTITCAASGKTYSGRISDVEYSDNWIASAYKLEINGKNCGRITL